jgi:TonB family protein
VVVQVTVDEGGHVILASPMSGHPLLRAAAVAAARKARFAPTLTGGKSGKTVGTLTYHFE